MKKLSEYNTVVDMKSCEGRKSIIWNTPSGQYLIGTKSGVCSIAIIEQEISMEVREITENQGDHLSCKVYDSDGGMIFEGTTNR